MSNEIVSSVYKWVIDDVIEKMANDFALLGVDESILIELQQSWEQKLIASKVATFPDPSAYENPSDEYAMYPPPDVGTTSSPHNGNLSSASSPSLLPHPSTHNKMDAGGSSSSQNYGITDPNESLSGSRSQSNNDINAFYQLNQTDGSQEGLSPVSRFSNTGNKPKFDLSERRLEKRTFGKQKKMKCQEIELEIDHDSLSKSSSLNACISSESNEREEERKVRDHQDVNPFHQRKIIHQVDGLDDDDDDDEDLDDEEEGGINSDLDDEDSEEEVETDHIILCQYEKVTRIKNKWKASLRDGIMTINGKDYLFNKASGDFEW